MGALAQDNPIWPSLASFLSLPSASSRSALNAAFAALLQTSAPNLKDYVWTERERPLIAHNQFGDDEMIPVIDMGAFTFVPADGAMSALERQKAQRSVATQMAKASQEWGFFQVTNHGVPEDLIKEMERHARDFFELLKPEEKRRILRDGNAGKPMGYACGGAGTRLKSDIPWIESLHLPSMAEEMDGYAWKVWQDGNKDFRRVVKEFSRAMGRVSMKLIEVLVGELALGQKEKDGMMRCKVEDGVGSWSSNSVVRFNYYPPCPQPALTLGLGAHSDPHLLTLLHQDLVGGLQICKDGLWMAIRPKPNALVVNIGDALQVWSNDVYKSVEHRAVCNSVKPRLSMGFFLNPLDETIITPLKSSSPLYKPFTWKEYRECMYAHRPRGKSNLLQFKLLNDQQNKSNIM
ncbi:hypothetical protein GOP47_0002909 [Adiantum capillus-veneris]|uniref:Fe2OG dioxygenase domain-containing protein n=1 Tax=Adiantum capillus-veneris TaxID=13818 RepID=A0A9D4VCH9_ADICA|nr:hypothetical protein GOP47_0002909 [Adiantum capillus-veneris]